MKYRMLQALTGAVVILLALVAVFLFVPNHTSTVAVLFAVAPFVFGLTITAIRAPNEPPPVASYAANVVILVGDGGSVAVPLPTAFSNLLANYNGTGVPATNAQLHFGLTCLAGTIAGVTVVYNSGSSPGSLTITQGGGAAAATFYVAVRVPTTNNAP